MATFEPKPLHPPIAHRFKKPDPNPYPDFDPDGAAEGEGVFGLPHSEKHAEVVLVPVPFDATTSYRRGCAQGPDAIREASAQVDLFDPLFGPVHHRGIFMLDTPQQIAKLSDHAGKLAELARDASDPASLLAQIEDAGKQVNDYVARQTSRIYDAGKRPGIIGGEHSVPYAAIAVAAERFAQSPAAHHNAGGPGLGILHIDAHLDLREAYEGFRFSHASIMYNVLKDVPAVTRLVSIGIRDVGKREVELAERLGPRVRIYPDLDLHRRRDLGKSVADVFSEALDALPHHVWISFDIDALDPSLCPSTGTPVPGGLSYNDANLLLETAAESGRTIVGFDLVEVTPGTAGELETIDANIGARILYKLCGTITSTN